jgi:hypothetical protein
MMQPSCARWPHACVSVTSFQESPVELQCLTMQEFAMLDVI